MSATDNGRIDEIISALQFLGKEKLICYSEEIKWLTELKQRLANSEWRNVEYELPPKREDRDSSNEVLVTGIDLKDVFRYNYASKCWLDECNGRHWGITHWMPVPEEPKNK